jgi:hypothetical protein
MKNKNITFNCVYHHKAIKVKKYLKTIKEFDDIINYMEIANKLTKNDYYSKEPSDIVINSYLIKYLIKSLLKNENKNIYYVFSEIDIDIINSLKTYLDSILPFEIDIVYNLHIGTEDRKDLSQEITNEFEDIIDIKNV